MSKILLGVICGLSFGIFDVLIMIPLQYENNRKKIEAMLSAFIERFMIAFLIPNVDLGIHPALTEPIIGTRFEFPF